MKGTKVYINSYHKSLIDAVRFYQRYTRMDIGSAHNAIKMTSFHPVFLTIAHTEADIQRIKDDASNLSITLSFKEEE
jgi:hypothetical protein